MYISSYHYHISCAFIHGIISEMKQALGIKKKPPRVMRHMNGNIPKDHHRMEQQRHSTSSLGFYGCIGKPVKHHYDNHAFYTEESAAGHTHNSKHVSFADVQIQTERASQGRVSQDLDVPVTVITEFPESTSNDFTDKMTVSQLEECLENMLARQQVEIENLNQKMATLKKKHNIRLRELHRKHKAERRRLLDLIRDCDEEKPCDIILVTDNSSGSVHPVNVYDV